MSLLEFSTSLVLSILLLLLHSASCSPNTAVRSVLCNVASYTAGDPFAISLDYVLAELEAVTPSRRSHDFRNVSPYPNAFAYGHAACNPTLTASDCATCLSAAKAAMVAGCNHRIGARGVLGDCSVRYEQYPFDD